MTRPVVTAVGRLLQPKHGEPRKHQLIQVDAMAAPKLSKISRPKLLAKGGCSIGLSINGKE